MNKKLIAGIVAILAVVGLGTWYFASPSYAMMKLRDAAVAGDADSLRERVDFPSVRDGLKTDLRAHLAKELAKSEGNGLEAFGAALAMNMVDGMVDGLITPESMAAMIKQGRFGNDAGGAPQGQQDTAPEWTIERDGFSRFIAAPVDAAEKAPRLIFQRDGLGWKLAEIDIPDGALGQ